MNTTHSRRALPAAICAALTVLAAPAAPAATAADGPVAARGPVDAPIVNIEGDAVRGVALASGYAFRGLPYAAAPTGDLRWRAPRAPAKWKGVRDATQFAPSCPQQVDPLQNPFVPPGRLDEDCLYLNVSTPALRGHGGGRPVLVWIHGGGLTQDAARNYDGSELAAEGTVVVTINYRLGALGFLAHPALASRAGGPAGNYGLMDQQAALRWVQNHIRRFGGDPRKVTIAGQSAGGLSVLAHLISRGSRGLFHRAIVQSGAFALTQQSLADAKAAGQTFAADPDVGCQDQTAQCLRKVPVDDLVNNFPGAAIPGVVDGDVLTESIGAALAGGRFARMPILNGINHDEQFLFVAALNSAVSNGTFVHVPSVTAANYQSVIATVLGVPAARAAAVAVEYPLAAYPLPIVAFSTLVSDANFACPALQVDRWTSAHVPTFAYQFNDDSAPHPLVPPGALPFATHSSELSYLFGLPNAPFPPTFNAGQAELAAGMRTAWANFVASGDPSSAALQWPSFSNGGRVLSLVQPQSQVDAENAARHHCGFWAAG